MSNTKVLIHAAGKSERWDGEGHKQLLKFFGESIIARLVRRVHEFGYTPTVVARSNGIIREARRTYLVDHLLPEFCEYHIETLWSSRFMWDDQTIVLFGDTLYASARLEQIFSVSEPYRFWGNSSQLFAMSFTDKEKIKDAIRELLSMESISGRLIDLYRQLEGLELGQTEIGRNYTIVDDPWTMDIDCMSEYKEVRRKTGGSAFREEEWG